MSDVVTAVNEAVADLETALPGLLDMCTDPQGTDVAEVLASIRDARMALAKLEVDAEVATAKAMLGDYAETPTLRVERYRADDRKTWDHEGWQKDLRAKVLQAHGLKGAQGVLDANGEVLDPRILTELLAAVESVHASGAPKVSKTSGLRAYGLDPSDYCETTKGPWKVRVLRMADESAEVA